MPRIMAVRSPPQPLTIGGGVSRIQDAMKVMLAHTKKEPNSKTALSSPLANKWPNAHNMVPASMGWRTQRRIWPGA